MADIVLTSLIASYPHCCLGLRYLMANLGELTQRAVLLEFEAKQRSVDVLEAILARQPRIVGIGVYVWNAAQTLQLVGELKRIRPGITVVLGGPEISHETQQQELAGLADYVICGEADLAFAQLCRQLLADTRPVQKIIQAELPALDQLALPYHLYDERDIANRVIYVEASRGCPFRCEFCLSSLDVPLRQFPLDAFLGQMQALLERGVMHFKFVDRTFNLNLAVSERILQFFHERYCPGMLLHFEMIPDRLPEALKQWIVRFPPAALQFEVGIQTFNEVVATHISRRQDNAKAQENLRFLRENTGVHVHADLIVGLPGEELTSFAAGFDRLVALRPQEIQVGMLKRLRGTPIARHDDAFAMRYSPQAPYEILENRDLDFATMQELRRFARYWDLLANSGHFVATLPLLWSSAAAPPEAPPIEKAATSPFHEFLALSHWLHEKTAAVHGIALPRLTMLLFEYLTTVKGYQPLLIARSLQGDCARSGKREVPPALRPLLGNKDHNERSAVETLGAAGDHLARAAARQARHLGR